MISHIRESKPKIRGLRDKKRKTTKNECERHRCVEIGRVYVPKKKVKDKKSMEDVEGIASRLEGEVMKQDKTEKSVSQGRERVRSWPWVL